VAAGLLAAGIVAIAHRRDVITGSWLQVIPIAGAALAYGLAAGLGGSGFIAAFLAGAIFGGLVHRESEQASRLNEELGELLGGVTFLIFGAVLLGPSLEHLSWQIALYSLLSLTVARMLRRLVRIASAWPATGDGERPRACTPAARVRARRRCPGLRAGPPDQVKRGERPQTSWRIP
jgi:NhaP-type Na+/H+ or K+/H+ antiporter